MEATAVSARVCAGVRACVCVGAWVVASMQQQAVGSIWDSFGSTHIPVAPSHINVPDARCSFFDLYRAGWEALVCCSNWSRRYYCLGKFSDGRVLIFHIFFFGLFSENGSI